MQKVVFQFFFLESGYTSDSGGGSGAGKPQGPPKKVLKLKSIYNSKTKFHQNKCKFDTNKLYIFIKIQS